jgi:hypothetical protein
MYFCYVFPGLFLKIAEIFTEKYRKIPKNTEKIAESFTEKYRKNRRIIYRKIPKNTEKNTEKIYRKRAF